MVACLQGREPESTIVADRGGRGEKGVRAGNAVGEIFLFRFILNPTVQVGAAGERP